MASEAQMAIVRRVFDGHNRQDAEVVAACYTPDAINHGRRVGREGLARVLRNLYAAFPDFHFESQLLLGDGDWIIAHIVMTGTHQGTPDFPVLGGGLVGVAPTGKPVTVQNIHLYRFEGDLIAEHRAVRDDLGMMQQLGLLPTTAHPSGDISRPPTG